VKDRDGEFGKNLRIIDTSGWLKNIYGISKKFLSHSGKGDWVLIDAKDLTDEKLREFIEGTKRVSQIEGPVPRR